MKKVSPSLANKETSTPAESPGNSSELLKLWCEYSGEDANVVLMTIAQEATRRRDRHDANTRREK